MAFLKILFYLIVLIEVKSVERSPIYSITYC